MLPNELKILPLEKLQPANMSFLLERNINRQITPALIPYIYYTQYVHIYMYVHVFLLYIQYCASIEPVSVFPTSDLFYNEPTKAGV